MPWVGACGQQLRAGTKRADLLEVCACAARQRSPATPRCLRLLPSFSPHSWCGQRAGGPPRWDARASLSQTPQILNPKSLNHEPLFMMYTYILNFYFCIYNFKRLGSERSAFPSPCFRLSVSFRISFHFLSSFHFLFFSLF